MQEKLNILKYYGGKFALLEDLLPFPKHTIYLEPFGGAAHALLNKVQSKVEIYNDINKILVNFWTIMKTHYLQLKQLAKYEICSRQLFEHFKEMLKDFESQRKIEAAFMFFYCNAFGYSGLKTFMGIHKHQAMAQKSYQNKIKKFKIVHNRIKYTMFEEQDFRVILNRFLNTYDLPDTLIYLDPPYINGGEGYQFVIGNEENEFTQQDHNDLIHLLYQFKHAKIVVSIDDPRYLGGWDRQKVVRTNKASPKDNSSKHIEYIYRNFDNSKVEKMKKVKVNKLSDW